MCDNLSLISLITRYIEEYKHVTIELIERY